MRYLHTPKNLHLIHEAAKVADLDEALRSVMVENGILFGDVAGQMFSGIDWAEFNFKGRVALLCSWLHIELQVRA